MPPSRIWLVLNLLPQYTLNCEPFSYEFKFCLFLSVGFSWSFIIIVSVLSSLVYQEFPPQGILAPCQMSLFPPGHLRLVFLLWQVLPLRLVLLLMRSLLRFLGIHLSSVSLQGYLFFISPAPSDRALGLFESRRDTRYWVTRVQGPLGGLGGMVLQGGAFNGTITTCLCSPFSNLSICCSTCRSRSRCLNLGPCQWPCRDTKCWVPINRSINGWLVLSASARTLLNFYGLLVTISYQIS